MNLPRTLPLYVAREILQYSLLGFTAITAVLVADQLLRRLDDLVAVGMSSQEISTIAVSTIAVIAPYALPISFIFGTLIGVLRLAGDNEILATRACGMGPGVLLAPALAVATSVSLLTAWLVFDLEHAARAEIRSAFRRAATRGAIITPGTFRELAGRILYVEERTRNNQLSGIWMHDGSDPNYSYLVVAEHGHFHADEDLGRLTLSLQKGEIHFDPDAATSEKYWMISFRKLDYSVDLGQLLKRGGPRFTPEQMSPAEIRYQLGEIAAGRPLVGVHTADVAVYHLEQQRRLAHSFVPFIFVLVAVPIGLLARRSSRSIGVLACAAICGGYYALLSLGISLMQEGIVAPLLAAWTPNIVLAAIGIFLLRRSTRMS